MSGLVYLRGGMPAHVNGSTQGSGGVDKWLLPGGVANYFWFRNNAAAAIILSFSQVDADNGVGVSIAAGAIWEGPAEVGTFWTAAAAAGAHAFESIGFIRRG